MRALARIGCMTALALATLSVSPVDAARLLPRKVVKHRAGDLGTRGANCLKAREILTARKARAFRYPTLIVAMEKGPRKKILGSAFVQQQPPEERAIADRLRAADFCGQRRRGLTRDQRRQCKLDKQRRSRLLQKYLDKGKRTFVSHVLFWEGGDDSEPELLHNAYVRCDNSSSGEQPSGYDCGKTPYANSWASLERLEGWLAKAVRDGRFTHVLLFSKGWNTRQRKAVDAYETMAQLLGQQAAANGEPFRPLIVGLTWNSGWTLRLSKIPILCLIPKVSSYGSRARDADEIGLTWANALLNRAILPAAAPHDVPVVIVAHSFGARMLTRAAASADLLDAEPPKAPDLLVSQQGAYSMNRFLIERCSGKEGAPYWDLTTKVDTTAVLWSRNDKTNPLAGWISGANHTGAKPGHQRARAYSHRFDFKKWHPTDGWVDPDWNRKRVDDNVCVDPPDVPQIDMIDASKIVKSHGDVDDEAMAALLWELMRGI